MGAHDNLIAVIASEPAQILALGLRVRLVIEHVTNGDRDRGALILAGAVDTKVGVQQRGLPVPTRRSG